MWRMSSVRKGAAKRWLQLSMLRRLAKQRDRRQTSWITVEFLKMHANYPVPAPPITQSQRRNAQPRPQLIYNIRLQVVERPNAGQWPLRPSSADRYAPSPARSRTSGGRTTARKPATSFTRMHVSVSATTVSNRAR